MTVTDVNVVKSTIFERPDDANKGTLFIALRLRKLRNGRGGGYVGKGCVKNGHRSCKMCLAEKYLPDCCPNDS